MTITKEILMHGDFTSAFVQELCGMLEAAIDAEFEKGDDTDFDFIDECAQAINSIRSGETVQVLPVISRKEFMRKIGIDKTNRFRTAAVCAALALVLAAGTLIKTEEKISLIQAFTGAVSEFFKEEKAPLTTVSPSVTTEKAELINVFFETTDVFRTEYRIGEKFSTQGIKVIAEYSDGSKQLFDVGEYTVEISEDFGTAAQYEKVTLHSHGFSAEFTVRVIEGESTKKLNSIYAVFPEGFDFTTDDFDSFECDGMRVYAVYSNGDEKELSSEDFVVVKEKKGMLGDRHIMITVTYDGCSCSFAVYER